MAALYGRVHGLGPRQQTRKAMNKETDAGAVHMETIRATISEGGRGGATKALVVAMATMHTARLKRGEKQEMIDTPVVPARSVSAACPSTKPLQLPAAMNSANVLMGCHLVNGVLHIRTRSNVSQKQRAAAATDLRGGMSAIALSVLRAPGH